MNLKEASMFEGRGSKDPLAAAVGNKGDHRRSGDRVWGKGPHGSTARGMGYWEARCQLQPGQRDSLRLHVGMAAPARGPRRLGGALPGTG